MSNLPDDIRRWIEDSVVDKANRLRRTQFLKSEYAAPIWECYFPEGREFKIDWRVRLADGSLLTDSKNLELWDEFRMFLCAQEYTDNNKTKDKFGVTVYYNVRCAMRVIDYLLLNDATLKLHRHALKALTASDVKRMLAKFTVSGAVADIYDWNKRLSDYLREQSKTITWDDICRAVKRNRKIVDIEFDAGEQQLSLSEREIIYSRLWLCREGLAVRGSSGLEYSMKPNMTELSSRIFSETIAAAVKRSVLLELCWARKESYACEYPRAPVQAAPYEDNQPASIAILRLYFRVARRLRDVAAVGKIIPQAALRELTQARPELYISQILSGNYVIPSVEDVNFAFGKAVEFFKNDAEHIFSSFVSVARAKCSGRDGWRRFLTSSRVKVLVEKETLEKGVGVWSVARDFARAWPGSINQNGRLPASMFFESIRRNEGLLELVHIAIGACLFIVGAITGRRQGELKDLDSETCIDLENRLLKFSNRKTGYRGHRQIIERPIPKLVVDVISRIKKFHEDLSAIKGMPKIKGIFATFSDDGECVLSHASMNRLLDRLCDYIEMPLNESGQRKYLRQHQLRRLFVTTYFMRRSGTLDALSWYLGHVSFKQVDAYIDFDFSVEERERVQVHVAVEALKVSKSSPFERLRAVIESKFGSTSVVVDESEAVKMFLYSKRHEGDGQIIDEVLKFSGGRELALHIA
ncbi:site-specific integrase [Burkholderia pseudomallei]|nr:site-specific integrase [Burkholderia pseudomallei]MBF3599281.1 site-specific integrase [Burkholderia pseudomallei]